MKNITKDDNQTYRATNWSGCGCSSFIKSERES